MRKLFFQVFPSIMLPMFLSALDQTIVSTALPAIAGALGNVEQISGVVVSCLLANTIAAPIEGLLGDALGRRRMRWSRWTRPSAKPSNRRSPTPSAARS